MGRTCFFLNCTNKTRMLKQPKQKKFSFFRPLDPETLEKWKKAIGPSYREMTMKDSVCQVHFDDDSIVRFYEHKLKDGTICRLERGLPCLKPGSIPSFSLEAKTSLDVNEESEFNSNEEESEFNSNEESEFDLSIRKIKIEHSNEILSDFNFNDVIWNQNEIELPSTLWGASVISEMNKRYFIVTKWFNQRPERWVVIDEDLNSTVIFKEIEIKNMCQKVYSLDDINRLLKTVHQCVFCLGVNDKNVINCLQILKDTPNSRGRKRKFCSGCAKLRCKNPENSKVCTDKGVYLPGIIIRKV